VVPRSTVAPVSEDRTPLDQALGFLVYAPFGMFLTVTEELPKLVEKGRSRLTSQLGLARMMGKMAAPHLQSEASKLVGGLIEHIAGPARSNGPGPNPSAPTAGDNGRSTGAPSRKEPSASEAPSAPRTAHNPDARINGSQVKAGGGADESLAIPGYDTLSAMQVVQRLDGLDATELAAVRDYEAAHRGRKTILGRADQLLPGLRG
jgi:hypothetical protein